MLSIPKPVDMLDFKSNQVLVKKKRKKPIVELENATPLRLRTLNEVPHKINRNIQFETNSAYTLDNYHYDESPRNKIVFHDTIEKTMNNVQPNYIYMKSNKPILHPSEINISSRNHQENTQQPCIIYNILQDGKNNHQIPINTSPGQQFDYYPTSNSINYRGIDTKYIGQNYELNPQFEPSSMNFRGMKRENAKKTQFNAQKYNVSEIEDNSTVNEIHYLKAQSTNKTGYYWRNSNCASLLWLSLLTFMLLLLQGLLYGLIFSESIKA